MDRMCISYISDLSLETDKDRLRQILRLGFLRAFIERTLGVTDLGLSSCPKRRK